MGKYDNISTGSNSTSASASRKGSPSSFPEFKPSKQGAAWLPLLRRLDKIKKANDAAKLAAKEKLKINPAPTTTTTTSSGSDTPVADSTPAADSTSTDTTTSSGSGGTTTTQDMQIDPKKDDQKGGGKKPPKKKKPDPKKGAGTPSDLEGSGSNSGDVNL